MGKKSRRAGRRERHKNRDVEQGQVLDRERFGTLYTQRENLVYTAVLTATLGPSQLGSVPTENKVVYISSRRLGDHEVIYGSLLQAIDEAVRPIFQSQRRLSELHDIIPPNVRSSVVADRRNDGGVSLTLPPGNYADLIFHKQEEILKDALLLSGTYVRTLLEDFSGHGNVPVPVYDRDGTPVEDTTLANAFHTLAHHRYCAVSDEFVHDVFSNEMQLGPEQLAGAKMKVPELFNAVCDFVASITVKDFVGVLRGRLKNLSIESDRSDTLFAVQNVASIAQIISERLAVSGDLPEFMQFLIERHSWTASKERALRGAEAIGKKTVQFNLEVNRLSFKIGEKLHAKTIEMHITINDEPEVVEFSWDEFFGELVSAHGDEQLVPGVVLQKRFAYLDAFKG